MVVIRTLDIGADKQADYFELPKEENPAMGLRAIRICLDPARGVPHPATGHCTVPPPMESWALCSP